jgi:hypothetical protein
LRTCDFTTCGAKLFEAGLTIEKVALITGHKNWDMLRRYTRLNPEDLIRM